MEELRQGCAVCWVMGEIGQAEVDEERWRKHRTMQCEMYVGGVEGTTGMRWNDLDEFRRGIQDDGQGHSCWRCWVS